MYVKIVQFRYFVMNNFIPDKAINKGFFTKSDMHKKKKNNYPMKLMN